jgi:hypothetical protein
MNRRGAVIVLLGAALFPIGKAYTASNTVGGGPAGQGNGGISGYAVSGISFAADSTDPTRVASVSFSISPASARSVRVQLHPGGEWFACANTSGAVVCPTPSGPAVATASALDVVASS